MAPLQKDGRSKRLCWGVLLVVLVLLADMIVGIIVVFSGTSRDIAPLSRIKPWCVKCEIQGHGEICCAENTTMNAEMLNKIYTDSWKKAQVPNIPASSSWRTDRNLRPHAHLQGIKMIQDTIGNEHLATVETWYDDKEGSSDIDNGVVLRHGRLVAPLSGIYLIYTHMDFTEQYMSTSGNVQYDQIEHKIFRFNILREDEGEELLFGKTLSQCTPRRHGRISRGNEEYGSYVGAMAHLQAGDEISIRVTNINFLSNNPNSHYFGMHML